MRWTWSLPARPVPQTALLTSCGVYEKQRIPAIPAESSATPRAWPTEKAVRAFWPKKRSSIAIASGSCSEMRSEMAAWMRASRRSSGSVAEVSITPPSSAASVAPRASTTPYPVFAAPGSMPITTTTGLILRAGADACPRPGYAAATRSSAAASTSKLA